MVSTVIKPVTGLFFIERFTCVHPEPVPYSGFLSAAFSPKGRAECPLHAGYLFRQAMKLSMYIKGNLKIKKYPLTNLRLERVKIDHLKKNNFKKRNAKNIRW